LKVKAFCKSRGEHAFRERGMGKKAAKETHEDKTPKSKEEQESVTEEQAEGVVSRVPFWIIGACGALAGSLFGMYLKWMLQTRAYERAMEAQEPVGF
jgi:hypothetical protein